MSFIVILVCFAVQWFSMLRSSLYQLHWSGHYIAWMQKRFAKLTQGHALFDMLLLVLPMVIALSLIFTLVYHVLGRIGYSALGLGLLWYCTDIAILKRSPAVQTSSTDLFLNSYQTIFAPVFWYFVFGSPGLIVYRVVVELRVQLPAQKYLILTQGVLDWVPIRLVGLTFALAGNFGAVFKIWMKELFQPVSDNCNQVDTFGMAALATDSDSLSLVHRSVLIWLVMMALITLGHWVAL